MLQQTNTIAGSMLRTSHSRKTVWTYRHHIIRVHVPLPHGIGNSPPLPNVLQFHAHSKSLLMSFVDRENAGERQGLRRMICTRAPVPTFRQQKPPEANTQTPLLLIRPTMVLDQSHHDVRIAVPSQDVLESILERPLSLDGETLAICEVRKGVVAMYEQSSNSQHRCRRRRGSSAKA